MGYCSKRLTVPDEKSSFPFTIDRVASEIELGKWLYLYDNYIVELPPRFRYFHPGGLEVLRALKGADIGRYINGSYHFQGQSFKHKHSPYALNFLLKHVIGHLA